MDSDSGQFILKQQAGRGKRMVQREPAVTVEDGKPKGPKPTAPHVRRGRHVVPDGFTVSAKRAGHRDTLPK